ncbi:hypothetical protein [Clostridium sp.]|uniref:hypothetical protein n=1 Tax=Clostridium sp. TaxID=1506 RepID=UPI00262B9D39|nr:hypothetical protein [Clostridium sp.]
MANDFKTIMLLKCFTNKKYAQDFLDSGKLKFGNPQEWIEAWEKEGSGRGDLLEGSFASIASIMKQDYIRKSKLYRLSRSNTIEMIDSRNGHIHFKSQDVLNLPTCCFFGLNDNMFTHMSKGEDGEKYPSGKIKKSYFKDFAKSLDKETYKNCSEEERPALIIINNPMEFRRRFINYFISNGLKPEEIFYAPVEYVDKDEEFFIESSMPTELFTKDIKFSNQSEIRIVLNTKNKNFLKMLNKSNGIIELGNMSDIARIEDYYFEDFIMQKRGNTLIYKLSIPKLEELPQDIADFFNSVKKTDTITAYQTINGKRCPLIVERDNKTGKIIRIHP